MKLRVALELKAADCLVGKVKLVKLRVVLKLEAADCLTGTFELLLQAVDAGTSLFLDSLFLDSLLIGVEAG